MTPKQKAGIAPPTEEEIFAGPTGLEDITVADRAFWIDDPVDRAWASALEAIDKKRDHEPLARLFESPLEITPLAREFLADYHRRQRKQGRRIPAYDHSEAHLELAKEAVRALRKKKVRVRAALEHVSKSYGIDEMTLADAYAGRRGSTRRMKKGRP
jgi:hypothetical protein